ncbi:MAG: hypothetical protein M3390_07520, partial [Chloroflexota bacterium]|nr:hypothetical protein [Chloroflexota bacterium]
IRSFTLNQSAAGQTLPFVARDFNRLASAGHHATNAIAVPVLRTLSLIHLHTHGLVPRTLSLIFGTSIA